MKRGPVLLGAAAWISTIQFFVVSAIVASRWSDPPYSYRINTISSLGVTKCLTQGTLYVCSPWHAAANLSWVVSGCCQLAGAILTAPAFPRDRVGRCGLWIFGVSGAGLVLVGLNPDNVRGDLHAVGAILALIGGDLALVLLGLSLRRARHAPREPRQPWQSRQPQLWSGLGSAAILFGIAGLVAVPLMLAFQDTAEGALERVGAYPVIAFYILFGLAIVRTRPEANSDHPAG